MRKILFTILFFQSQFLFSQRIIFTNPFGGTQNNGGISSYDFTSGRISTPIGLSGKPLGLVDGWRLTSDANSSYYNTFLNDDFVKENGLYAASDGYIYGLDQFADRFYDHFAGNAILYRFHPDTLRIEVLHSFTGSIQDNTDAVIGAFKNTLSKPRFGMIEGAAGVLYGICIQGGLFDKGGIWKYEIAKRKFSEVSSFDPTLIGVNPTGPLFKAFNNQLYGILQTNNTSREDGVLFQISTNKDSLIKISSLSLTQSGFAISGPTGPAAYNSTVQKIYGTKRVDPGAGYGGGIYSYDFNTKEVVHLNGIFQDRDILGSIMTGLVRGNNGAYYAVTYEKGGNNNGTLLMMRNPSSLSGDLIKVADFKQSVVGNSLIAVGDKIFGTYKYVDGGFSMWCYNISSNLVTNLLPYGSSGLYGVMPTLAVSGNKIFARALFGGLKNSGGLVSINAGSLESTEILQANDPGGKSAVGELLPIGNNEYLGFSNSGGNLSNVYRNLSGTIVKYNLSKRTATTVASLETMTKAEIDKVVTDFPNLANAYENYTSAYKPFSMVRGSNGKVYFYYNTATIPWYPEDNMYKQHQAKQVFNEFDPATNTIKELAKINYGLSVMPLEYLNGKFLLARFDSLLIYDVANGTLTGSVKPFSTNNYGSFYGKWTKASDGLIYGISSAGVYPGSTEKSVLYSLDPTSNFKFTVLQDLSSDINQANIAMTEWNGKLYGSTATGGNFGHGYIFSYDMAAKLFSKLYHFNAANDGANFSAAWTLNNGKLYSTSPAGGANDYGTLVEFNPSNNLFNVLSHLTIQNGRGVYASPLFTPYPIYADSSDINANDTIICSSNSAVLKASSSYVLNPVFKWYSDSTLTNLLYTGETYTTPVLSTTSRFYISVSGTGVLENPSLNGKKITVLVNTTPSLPIITSTKQSICVGDSSILTSSNTIGNQWFKDGNLIVGAMLATYKAISAGSYTVQTTSVAGCKTATSAALLISLNPLPSTPVIEADGTLKICKDESRNLSVLQQGNHSTQWYKNGSSITGANNSTISVNETGNYTNRLISTAGCASSFSNTLLLEVVCNTAIMMPDVFSPNGDGINDKVYPIIPGLKYLRTFEIYNRIGNLVFSTNDSKIGWDGTFRGSQQPADTYLWVIEGVDGKGNKMKKTGMITLIR